MLQRKKYETPKPRTLHLKKRRGDVSQPPFDVHAAFIRRAFQK